MPLRYYRGDHQHNSSSIMSKTISVTTSSGDIRVKVSNETEFDRVLKRNKAAHFVDGEQIQIYGFDSLEHDGIYTFGPAPAALAQQKRSPRKRAPVKRAPTDLAYKTKGTGAGVKKGGTRNDKPQAFWFLLCQKYENSETTWKSQTAFLRSEESGPEAGEDHKMSFSRALKKYRVGTLENVNETRVRRPQYEAVENRAADHLDPAAHGTPVRRVSKNMSSPSILAFFSSTASTGTNE
jgi:hypothetical protein